MVDIAYYKKIFEQTPLALLLVDKQLNNIETNAEFCRMTGISREKILSMKITDFKDRGVIKYLRDSGETFADAMAQKRIVHGRSTLETLAGRIEVLRTIDPLLDEKGELQYVYISYNDITKISKNQEYMVHEIDELSKIYGVMAQGDLTPRYTLTSPDADTKETFDQISQLQVAVRGIITSLQTNIRAVNKQMLDLTTTANTAASSTKDASGGIAQIAKNAGRVSENAEKAAEGVEQIAKAMQDMSAAVEEITSSMEQVSTLSRETNEISKKGAVLAGNAEKSMVEISKSSGSAYEIIMDVDSQMGEIAKIVLLIREIANQTNLLALNAAIEAARAGDAGRGFAVVASEVKSLAQESRKSAERIEDMIETLKTSTDKAATVMKVSKGTVETGAKMVTETLKVFETIVISVDKVTSAATEVAAATEEQAATTEEITASIHEVADLVDHTAKEAGDAAAATEESSAALDEISRMVAFVDTTALAAMEANRKFKVD
ncbi:MAG: methyl-accepting chemotaxis protein [Methanoregula sp.]|jgi:methyl-accepting chemotaxis protein